MPRLHVSPSMVVASASLLVALSGWGYAATGGSFVLGQSNSADATSSLSSTSTAGPALAVASTGGKPAAAFTVGTGVAPFTVSSKTKVARLNADTLDGVDSTGFLAKGGKASDADKLDGLDSTGFLQSKLPIALSGPGGEDVLTATNTGNGRGLSGLSDSSQGVYGHSNTNVGVGGESTSLDGVWGQSH